jgi:8-oxo-dGTP pyrophosphatase MutT (NUDIX family)
MSIHKGSNEIITTKNRCDGEFTLYRVIVVHVTDYYLANQCAAMQQIFEKSPNCYVLFVGYEEGDAQPGITGSCIEFSKGVYERPSVAAVRELEEETGFTTRRGNLEWFDTRYYSDIGRHATIYLLDVRKCVEAIDVKIDNSKSGKKGCCVAVWIA